MAGISTGFNFGAIGNVGLYAKQLVNSYTAKAKASAAAGNDSYASVISNTVANTQKFASTNTANLKGLKTSASSLATAASNLGVGKKGTSADQLVSAAEKFASSYNKTIGHLTSGGATGAGVDKALGYVTDNRITNSSAQRYGTYAANRLANMGISIDEDGKMQIDADKLKEAATKNPSSVKNTLTGYGSIAQVTQQNADKAMRIPTATYTDFSGMQAQDSLLDALLPKVGAVFDLLA